jgi:tRNA U34 5-methylaminomethyl-2-thiouridine-forming methyltransferase MnmC
MTGWIPQVTDDGSFTFFSEEFGEAFHSRQGAHAEAVAKFAQATGLPEKARFWGKGTRDLQPLCILDICYGLGYNTAAALETIWAVNPSCEVSVYGLELDISVPRSAVRSQLLRDWSPPVQQVLQGLAETSSYHTPHLTAQLLIGDARQTIQTLAQESIQADAIFLDPFSPRRCPQLWTVEFLQVVARCLAPAGKLSTYSRSAAVRSALLAAGLQVGTLPLGKRHLPHEWAQGTIAAWNTTDLPPLSVLEQEHLHTRAAIPYRDPNLSDPATVILQRHQEEQQRSSLESTSSWRRRWQII